MDCWMDAELAALAHEIRTTEGVLTAAAYEAAALCLSDLLALARSWDACVLWMTLNREGDGDAPLLA